jgi:GAF domain-containing protein
VFHELGKALTSSLQLDQVLRTIMEKIHEFLRPDTWSLLLLDQAKQELYFELAVGNGAESAPVAVSPNPPATSPAMRLRRDRYRDSGVISEGSGGSGSLLRIRWVTDQTGLLH